MSKINFTVKTDLCRKLSSIETFFPLNSGSIKYLVLLNNDLAAWPNVFDNELFCNGNVNMGLIEVGELALELLLSVIEILLKSLSVKLLLSILSLLKVFEKLFSLFENAS
jgi:hypothetical protein